MLGRKAALHDPRTLQLANYSAELPTPPSYANYTKKVSTWPMYSNDTIGDCTIAAAGHLIQDWTANDGHQVTIADADVITAYTAVSGYNPTTGANDNGANEIDVLNYWKKTGIGGHTIGAYTALQPKDENHIKSAVSIFAGCYIGLNMPISAQTQRIWSVPPGGAVGQGAPGSWGGHAVPVVGYNATYLLVVSWGAIYKMTWQFWLAYCEEAYAILSHDLLNGTEKAPDGFDLAQLTADLALVKN